MSTPYTLHESAVLKDGRATLTYREVSDFLNFAIRRKLRKRNHVSEFLSELVRTGESWYSWDFWRSSRQSERYHTAVHAELCGEGFHLTCSGPQADYAVDRASKGIEQQSANAEQQRHNWEEKSCSKPKKQPASRQTKRLTRKRNKLLESQVKRVDQPKKTKVRRQTPAPLSLTCNEKLTPQFRKQHVFWTEAIEAIVKIFQVRSNWKYTASQIVSRELRQSLEQSGGRFIKFSRAGFALRFDLVDGRWRGDITLLTISATKNNKHPIYRRMRAYFKDALGFLTDSERRERREKVERANSLPPNVIVWGGALRQIV